MRNWLSTQLCINDDDDLIRPFQFLFKAITQYKFAAKLF